MPVRFAFHQADNHDLVPHNPLQAQNKFYRFFLEVEIKNTLSAQYCDKYLCDTFPMEYFKEDRYSRTGLTSRFCLAQICYVVNNVQGHKEIAPPAHVLKSEKRYAA